MGDMTAVCTLARGAREGGKWCWPDSVAAESSRKRGRKGRGHGQDRSEGSVVSCPGHGAGEVHFPQDDVGLSHRALSLASPPGDGWGAAGAGSPPASRICRASVLLQLFAPGSFKLVTGSYLNTRDWDKNVAFVIFIYICVYIYMTMCIVHIHTYIPNI